VPPFDTVDFPWLAEPDEAKLRQCLRYIVAHPDEAHSKGQAAASYIRRNFSWDRAADAVAARLEQLQRRPVLRLAPAPSGNVPAVALVPARQRPFAEPRPTGNELASLIILCCNQLNYTRECLESVLQNTRQPYELILVDNGSTDGTAAYLQELQQRAGPERVVVIHNETNRGFAAGCNQGLQASAGRYLVLLNNDTVVTTGWLDGLIRWTFHKWPGVGLVGPVTSWPAPQSVPVDYRSAAELQAFAARRRKDFAGQGESVARLVGFCLLFRREVWEELGGLDETFGLGFFEDDDLCVRAREAGFELIRALDVFIHHHGNSTFKSLGIDAGAQLRANFERFRSKWGEKHSAPYKQVEYGAPPKLSSESKAGAAAAGPTSAASKDGARQKPRISLCMIVKNEERRLTACLASVADLVDEMIVVDTGSGDGTKEAALHAGARVYDFAWVDSFAAARNESLRHASGDWILWLDGDEQLDETNRQRLRKLFAGLQDENVAYVMRQESKLAAGMHAAAQVDQVRLFRNRPDIRWQYRVHEQILLAVRRSGGEPRLTDVVIEHAGFSIAENQDSKVKRNLRLLELELAEHPGDVFVLYNLGTVRLTEGRCAEALELFRRCLDNPQSSNGLARKLHALTARAYHQLGQKPEALAACRKGLKAFPEDGELLFWEAMFLRELKDLEGAAKCLERVLKARPAHYFTSVDAGLYGYRTRHYLAEIYRDVGRLEEAEFQWRTAVSENPTFTPAWRQLAELYYQSARWSQLEDVLPRLDSDPQLADEVAVLRGGLHLGKKEFSLAKECFRAASARATQALRPRVLLSHALLQEGTDWKGALDALNDVLAVDPDNKEAQDNLQVLHVQHPELWDPDGVEAKPTACSVRAAVASRAKVSLCMIVRNEENNLPACLQSVADLVQEMIVVDTGSTDRTKEIADKHGAKVFDFPWIDHFAAARNESLRHATGKWIFWLDADDRVDESNRAKLRGLFSKLGDDVAGYVMKCLCLPDSNGVATVVDHLRLFRKHPQVRWEFRVHEQILPALRKIGAAVRWSDVVIHHTGYQDPSLRQRKLQRDLRLLEVEQFEQPNHPFTLFNLGSVYQEMGRIAEALELFRKSLDLSAPRDSIVRKLYATITQCHRSLAQKTEALAACRAGLALFADDVELLFQEAVTLRELGDVAGAVERWERCLKSPPGTHFASINTGLRGHITRHNLAVAYSEQGRPADAETQWRAALAERPHYEPAWRALLSLYLEQRRFADAEEIARKVEVHSKDGPEVATVRGRLHMARKDFSTARRLFEGAILRWPRALEPRVLLSHSFLQEAKDWQAAEASLRDILSIDPNHCEANHNLGLLLKQRASA
jgi:glycosyltransferase involved in cell wall biosynthesis/Tfp pilus assembly protein PilF